MLDPTVPQVGSCWVIFEARGLPACPRSLSSAPDLVAPLVAPPFRRRAAAMLVGERRRSVRLGATLFTPSSGDAGGREALEYRSFPIGHSSRAYAHDYTSGGFRSVSGLKATAKIVP